MFDWLKPRLSLRLTPAFLTPFNAYWSASAIAFPIKIPPLALRCPVHWVFQMIDLFSHWVALETTPTGWRYWLCGASVLVTAAVLRGARGLGARAIRRGSPGKGRPGGGPARVYAACPRPRWATASWGGGAASERSETRAQVIWATLWGLGSEEGREAIHCRGKRGSVARPTSGWSRGPPQERERPWAPCKPPWSARPPRRRSGEGARGPLRGWGPELEREGRWLGRVAAPQP